MKKKKIGWFKKKLVRWRMNRGVSFLLGVHRLQEQMGWASWRKTQFWRDLEKSPGSRKALFEAVLGLYEDKEEVKGGKA